MKRINIIFSLAFLFIFANASFSALDVAIGDQGDNVIYKINGTLVDNGNLTVLIYDDEFGSNLIYNETFIGAIKNGSWNVMLGENTTLSLDYGFVYWKDYEINGEDIDFIDNSGNLHERKYWFSPLGQIQKSQINISSLNITEYWNRSSIDYIEPMNFSDGIRINKSIIIGIDGDGKIEGGGNKNLTISGGDGYCFTAGTYIKTPYGYVTIESLNIGDIITSYDIENGGGEINTKVTNVTSRVVTSYYTINNVINATGEHPFYTDKGWKKVMDLQLGDKLFDGNNWVVVFQKSQTNAPVLVYNIHVTYPYTFFANTFLVHNKDLTPKPGKNLFLHGGYPYLGSYFGDVFLAWDGSIPVGKAIVGGFLELYSGMQLGDDIPIYFDSSWIKSLSWSSLLQAFLFNDSLNVEGNVTANYFIGDGSFLTNINFSIPWTDINNDLIPSVHNSYSVGNSSRKWASGYFGNVYANYFYGDGSNLINLPVYWNRSGNMLYPKNYGDNVNVSGNINSFNYSIGDKEIMSYNRDIAFNESSYHKIGTFGYSSFMGLNTSLGNDANFMVVDSNGEIMLNGTARKTQSLYINPYNIYGSSGSYNGISCTASSTSILSSRWIVKNFADGSGTNVCDASVLTLNLPEDYQPNTNISIGLHWTASATTGNVEFGVGLLAVGSGESYTNTSTYVVRVVQAPAVAYTKNEALFNFSGDGFNKDDDISIVIYRYGDSASDTMTGDALITNVGLYYITDDFGSNKLIGT